MTEVKNKMKLIEKIENIKKLAVDLLPELEKLEKEIEIYRKTKTESTLDDRLGSLSYLWEIRMLINSLKGLTDWQPHEFIITWLASHKK